MGQERFTHIDIAKGIGIICVVLFHMPNVLNVDYVNNWGGWITSFYMPLFFILSGIFFNNQTSLSKRCKKLITPYLCFYILAYILSILKDIIKHQTINLYDFFIPFTGQTSGYENTPIWFLLSLIQITLIVFFLCKVCNKKYILITSLAISVTGYIAGKYHFLSHYYIGTSLLCTTFFVMGYIFKKYFLNSNNVIYYVLSLLISIILYEIKPNWNNVSQNYIPSGFILFLLVAITASYGLIGISRYLDRIPILNTFLKFFGRNSLIVLCTHMMLMFIPSYIEININNIKHGIFLSLFIILCIDSCIIIFINKYFRFMLGDFTNNKLLHIKR